MWYSVGTTDCLILIRIEASWLLDQGQVGLMFTLFLYTWARTFGSIHLEKSQWEECENLSEQQIAWSCCTLKQVWLLDQWQVRLMFTLFLVTWARTFGSIHLEKSQWEECENLSVGTTDCLILMRLEASLVTASGAGGTHVHIVLVHLSENLGGIHLEKSQWEECDNLSEQQIAWSWCALKQVWLLDQGQVGLMFTLLLHTWQRTFGRISWDVSVRGM